MTELDDAMINHDALFAKAKRGSLISQFVNRVGSENQRERHAEGLLPVEELRQLVRDHSVAHIDAPKYARLETIDIEHAHGCDVETRVTDTSVEPVAGGLSAAEYEALRALRRALPAAVAATVAELPGADVSATLREHRIWCDCGGEAKRRRGFLVTVEWAGIQVNREFALREV